MKTQKLIKLIILLAAVGLSACSKNNDNHTSPPVVGPIPGGVPPGGYFPQPPGYGFPLANAMGVHTASSGQPSVQLMVNMFGQAQVQPFTGQPLQAMVAGQILFGPEAVNPALGQYCPIPVGVAFPVQSMQPVMMSNRVLSDFRFQAGPMLIAIYQAQLDDLGGTNMPGPNGQLYNNFLAGELLVESVNGVPCQYPLGWFTLSRP